MENGLNYCNFTLVGTGGPAPWRWPFPDRRVFREKIMRDTVYFIVPTVTSKQLKRDDAQLVFKALTCMPNALTEVCYRSLIAVQIQCNHRKMIWSS